MKKSIVLLFLITNFISNAQQYSGMCFVQATGSPVATTGAPGNVASGDFNNDGKQDLAAAIYSGSKISIFLGNGSGSFSAGTPVSITAPNYVLVGDFNADGNKDLAVGSNYKISIFLGTGAGTFGAPTVYSNINYGPIYMTLADVNSDGIQDILCTTIGGSKYYYVLIGVGNGTFVASSHYAGYADDVTCLASGDVNSDGFPDIIFPTGSMITGYAAEVAFGNGTSNFTSIPYVANSTYYNIPSGGNQHMAMGDFNEDGKLDVAELMMDQATGTSSLNSVFISLNSGVAGSYYNSVTSIPVGANPAFVGVADFNMDNHKDLIVLNSGGNSFTILAGNGLGNFSAAGNYPTGNVASSITINDFNGDGFPDVAISNNSSSNSISVWLNAMPKVVTTGGSVCAGKPITLSASVTGADAYTYLWSTGSTGLTTVVSPVSPSSYNFIATNSSLQCSTTVTSLVTIRPAAAVFTVNNAAVCAGNSAPLTVNPTASHTSYAWLPASGLNIYTGANVIATPAATTVYTITATNTFGCSYSTTATAVVNPLPVLSVPSQSACVGESVTLTASGASTYVWSPSATLSSSTGSSVVASPAVTTLYSITGTSSQGCVSSTTSSVNLRTRPEIRIGNAPDSRQHLQPTKFYSSATGNSYVWSVSTAMLSSISFTGQGTNAISNVAWGGFSNVESTLQKVILKLDGCSTSLFLPLNVSPGPVLCNINGPTTAAPGSTQVYSIACGSSLFPGCTWFCDGGTILSGQGTGSVTIKWGTGYVGRLGYQATNPNINAGQNSTLDVALCASVAPVNPSNNSILTPNPVTVCASAGSIHLFAANTGSTYLWSTGSTSQTLVAPVNSTGYADNYYVTITNTNGCKSSFFQTMITNLGCRAAGVNNEVAYEANVLFYPNPANGSVFVEAVSSETVGEVVIRNLIGEIVYQSTINSAKQEINISHLSAGVYTLYNRGMRGKLVKE